MEYSHIIAPHRSLQLPSKTEDLAELHVGNKALSLLKLLYGNVPTPPFFVLPSTIFKKYILGLPQTSGVASLDDFRTLIMNNYLPKEVVDEIDKAYRGFANFGRAWVSVRPSIVVTDDVSPTFAGQLTTLLNIKETENIEKAIKEVYASLFSPGVAMYLRTHNLRYSQLGVAVIVQKMVQAEVSGVTYTLDPVTLDESKMAIEAVFGLGDVIANGEITPDFYLVDKEQLTVVEKKVIPQEWMRVREITNNNELARTKKLEISKIWQYAQKLEEPQIVDLVKVCKRIADLMRSPQHIEWVYEGGKIWVLQTRNFNKEPAGAVVTQEDMRIENVDDLHTFVDQNQEKVAVQPTVTASDTLNVDKELVFIGQGASSGIATAKALVIFSDEFDTSEELIKLMNSINEPTILVTDELANQIEEVSPHIKGIVTDYGGVTSDAAVLAREVGIPAVVGSRTATKFLKNGQWINIDGASGAVYRIEDETAVQKLTSSLPPETVNPQRQEIEKKLGELKALLQTLDDKQTPQAATETTPTAPTLPPIATTTKVMLASAPGQPTPQLGMHGFTLKMSDLIVHTGRHPHSYLKNKKRTVFLKKLLKYVTELTSGQAISELIIELDTLTTQQAYHLIGGQTYHDESVSSSLYYDQHPRELKLVLELLRKVKQKLAIPAISLAVQGLISPDQVAQLKRSLAANNWRRSATSHLYVVLDAPGLMAQLDLIIDREIDGFMIDIPVLYERSFNQKLTAENKLQTKLLEYIVLAVGRISALHKLQVLAIMPSWDVVDDYGRLLEMILANGTTMVSLTDLDPGIQQEIVALLQKTEKKIVG